LLHPSNIQLVHGNRSVLLYLNSSRWLSEEELSRRFKCSDSEYGGSVESQRALLVPYKTLKECVSGKDVGRSTLMACEGQLVRAVLGATDMSDMFGYMEAWICVASHLVRLDALKPVVAELWQLYFHACESEEADVETSEDQEDALELACELYSDALWRILEARRQFPDGCYELKDGDCLVSPQSLVRPDDYSPSSLSSKTYRERLFARAGTARGSNV
jgi:hypothetical protein